MRNVDTGGCWYECGCRCRCGYGCGHECVHDMTNWPTNQLIASGFLIKQTMQFLRVRYTWNFTLNIIYRNILPYFGIPLRRGSEQTNKRTNLTKREAEQTKWMIYGLLNWLAGHWIAETITSKFWLAGK